MMKEQELLPECPFFRQMKLNYIECEGMVEHSVVRSHFSRRKFLKAHWEGQCCSMAFPQCPAAKIIYAKYED